MSVTAATVTVYFVGLVHFYNVQAAPSGSVGSGEVYAPLAAPSIKVRMVPLVEHHAQVFVKGLDTARKTCAALGGTGTGSDCTFSNLRNTRVDLPITTTTPGLVVGTGFATVPRLRESCIPRSVTEIAPIKTAVPGGDFAVHVSLSRGELEACAPKLPWVTYLKIADAADSFSIGAKSVPLLPDASIVIRNEPTQPHGSGTEEAHFWWYYTLYDKGGDCYGLPSPGTAKCPQEIPDFALPYGTGIGCSNTQYP